jgi:hypothetical protein
VILYFTPFTTDNSPKTACSAALDLLFNLGAERRTISAARLENARCASLRRGPNCPKYGRGGKLSRCKAL